MLKSVISSAANLSLAPARLVGRVAGSLVRELLGDDAPRKRTRRRSAAPSNPTSRSRRRAQPKRTASHTRAKARARQTTPRSGGKAQPKPAVSHTRPEAQPKHAAKRARAKGQPRRAPQRKPLDDVTVARKVESIIFRDVEVDKGAVHVNVAEGVLWLRGEVPTPDLIGELEARANRITEVRRVENLLHLSATPAPDRAEPSRGETAPPAAGQEDEEPATHDEPARGAATDPDQQGSDPSRREFNATERARSRQT